MSRFPLPLITENLADGSENYTRLVEPFCFDWMWDKSYPLRRIWVPPGFCYDYESIPRPLQGIPGFDNDNLGAKPATIHDWIYQVEEFPRKICDKIYYDGLRTVGMNLFLANARYYAVRLRGGARWPHNNGSMNKNRKLYRDFINSEKYKELEKNLPTL